MEDMEDDDYDKASSKENENNMVCMNITECSNQIEIWSYNKTFTGKF